MSDLSKSEIEKISKLLLMLSSDKSGEVSAAASALIRVLKANGKDLHDLTAALRQPPIKIVYEEDWRNVAKECLNCRSIFSEKEQKFLQDMSHQMRDPTEKQENWLRILHDKMRRSGR